MKCNEVLVRSSSSVVFHTQGSVLSVFFFLAPFFCFSDLSRAVSCFSSAAAFKEREKVNMSQSNNGLQIFWLVKSYSLIVITEQCFFPNAAC